MRWGGAPHTDLYKVCCLYEWRPHALAMAAVFAFQSLSPKQNSVPADEGLGQSKQRYVQSVPRDLFFPSSSGEGVHVWW